MKTLLFVVVCLVLESAALFTPNHTDSAKAVIYSLGANSKLEVNGKTNINSFCCISTEQFSNNRLVYQYSETSNRIQFLDAKLRLRISEMDCGGPIINKDFQKTLKAKDYPFIELNLREAINQDCIDLEECDNWIFFIAKTNITLNGVTQQIEIPIHILKKSNSLYQITGTKKIELTSFKITPPTVMLGLIKVDNSIDIDFDLDVIID